MGVDDFLYRRVARPLLFRLNPDFIHDVMLDLGEFSGNFSFLRAAIGLVYRYRGPDISKVVDGVRYELPVLLSAGFDADGRLTRVLRDVSFGGEEIGSTTAHACSGNPKPRMVRLVRNKSLIVNKGLRNHGVDALIARLKRTPRVPGYVIGISIARTNLRASCIDVEAGIEDFVTSFRKLNEAGIGDYYTINISCPNTFDGEGFTEPKNLSLLLSRLKAIPCAKPVYLKMPINKTWEEFDELCRIADENGIRGLVIGNLNKDYKELKYHDEFAKKAIKNNGSVYQPGVPQEYRGGLSGTPCFERSNDLIRKTREKYGSRFTIIGCGGILTPKQAMEKLDAGADLLMLISGMIFETPGLMRNICYEYAKRVGA